MFKKGATYKSSATIRGSERKSLTADLLAQFPACFTDKSPEEVKEILDDILPTSGIESASFTSTKGHRGTLYFLSSVPIFIKHDNRLVPTLQTMWKLPCLIPTVLTGAQVLTNLASGSDLMVKGMFDYSADIKQGQVVGIRVTDKEHVVALGTSAIDFDKVDTAQSGKGILTWVCLGDTITPEAAYLDFCRSQAQSDSITIETEKLQLDDTNPDGTTIKEDAEERSVQDGSAADVEQAEPPMATADIDNAFYQALLYGLYTVESTGEQASLSFPINSSTLVDTYLLPYLPSRHPDLTFKKTSWKKAARFISKQKILKSKDNKGQLSVTGIDWDVKDLRSFVPYQLPLAIDPAKQTTLTSLPPSDSGKKSQIEVQNWYKLPAKSDPLCTFVAQKEFYSAEDLKELLSAYYSHNNLVTENSKMITLDTHISHLLAPMSTHKTLSRDVLHRSLLQACSQHYRIINPYFSSTPASKKIRSGPPPTILIKLETRNGKRATTKIINLQHYLATPEIQELQDRLKVKCQASVSQGETNGGKPGMNMEIVVQGKWEVQVIAVLKEQRLNKEWVKIEDMTK